MTKLERMLKYVSEHNDFYKRRIKEYGITNPLDITQWPILTRKELQENRYNMFSDGYKSKYLHQQLKRQSSSGSTGIPVTVYWDYPDYYASTLHLWRRRYLHYGVVPNDRRVTFTLNTFNLKYKVDDVLYKYYSPTELSFIISLIQETVLYNKVIDIIDEFQPKWLYIQPFILQKLLLSYIKNDKKPPKSLAYIESVGELLTADLKQKVIDFFKVPIANLYGSEEMNGIAFECPHNHMHIISENVHVQQSDFNGSSIITSLTNKAMPLIRYDQSDIIKIRSLSDSCSCGFSDPVIDIITGRSSENLYTKDGFELNSLLLMEIIAEVNNQFDDIVISYNFIYYKQDHKLKCYIKVDSFRKEWFYSIQSSINEIFKRKISSNINIVIEVCSMNEYQNPLGKQKILKIVD